MLVVSQVLVAHVEAQAPFYGRPWPDYYGQAGSSSSTAASNGASSTTTRPSTTVRLTDRIQPDRASFRFYNNVPIEGPNDPCIGCMYQLTKDGFIRA
jgi:hypothetical protein